MGAYPGGAGHGCGAAARGGLSHGAAHRLLSPVQAVEEFPPRVRRVGLDSRAGDRPVSFRTGASARRHSASRAGAIPASAPAHGVLPAVLAEQPVPPRRGRLLPSATFPQREPLDLRKPGRGAVFSGRGLLRPARAVGTAGALSADVRLRRGRHRRHHPVALCAARRGVYGSRARALSGELRRRSHSLRPVVWPLLRGADAERTSGRHVGDRGLRSRAQLGIRSGGQGAGQQARTPTDPRRGRSGAPYPVAGRHGARDDL